MTREEREEAIKIIENFPVESTGERKAVLTAIKALEQDPNRDMKEIEEIINCDADAEIKLKMISNIVYSKSHYFKPLEQESCDTCEHSDEINGSNCYECVKGIRDRYNPQPCEDAISREEAIKQCGFGMTSLIIADCLRRLPPVTSQLKMGHWITTRTFMHDGEFYCDKCNCDAPNNEKWDYCPNCGATMSEGKE